MDDSADSAHAWPLSDVARWILHVLLVASCMQKEVYQRGSRTTVDLLGFCRQTEWRRPHQRQSSEARTRSPSKWPTHWPFHSCEASYRISFKAVRAPLIFPMILTKTVGRCARRRSLSRSYPRVHDLSNYASSIIHKAASKACKEDTFLCVEKSGSRSVSQRM